MTVRPTVQQLAAEVPSALAALLAVPAHGVESGVRADGLLLVEAVGHAFMVGTLGSATPGPVAAEAERLLTAVKQTRRRVTPLLAVPFMTDAGRRETEAAQVPWFDLSGNAHIVAPGLRVIVAGQPDRFRSTGRPSSVFAPKSARVARWLLMHPGRAFTQREVARATEMAEGFVSRIASRLETEIYVVRSPSGALQVKDRARLLEAWRSEYRIDRHTLVAGRVAARSGESLTRIVGDTLVAAGVEHAATGLSAAWQWQHFASFRLATFFVTEPPRNEIRARLGFREEARGTNLWLVIPNDAGVFQGAAVRDGVRCVHPVQAYMDLKGHPERAAEAAAHLRTQLLSGASDG